MKQVFLSIVVLLLFGCVKPPQYTPEDLARHDAKQIEGVIAKQSRGSFLLRDQEGVERLFRTGELTQYIPEGYRSLEGDTVHIAYKPGTQAVLQLRAISILEKNKPLPSSIEGEITGISRGSSRHSRSIFLSTSGNDNLQLYIPFDNVIVMVDGEPVSPLFTWEEAVGTKAKIYNRRVPIFRGNGYLYEAEQIHIEGK